MMAFIMTWLLLDTVAAILTAAFVLHKYKVKQSCN